MAGKTVRNVAIQMALIVILVDVAQSSRLLLGANEPIPSDASQLQTWFNAQVQDAKRPELDPELVKAESSPPKIIKVRKDGSGNFKTVIEAVNSIPVENTNRIIVHIGGGVYTEKIKIERNKPFITFLGSPKDVPTLMFGGTAAQYGTVESATFIVESDYFVAANINVTNSAPKPDGKRVGAQALAFRIGGNKASLYNCHFIGYQDTLCDDKGRHLFKDCFIEGTVDFIFGSGKSLYLNSILHVIGEDPFTVVTAHARASNSEDTGLSFVHCKVTGKGNGTFLGRAWTTNPSTVFAYSELSPVVHPQGWTNNFHPERDNSVTFGEYKNTGPGADLSKRAKFVKQLSDADAQPFLNLNFIEGSKWILPPPNPAI